MSGLESAASVATPGGWRQEPVLAIGDRICSNGETLKPVTALQCYPFTIQSLDRSGEVLVMGFKVAYYGSDDPSLLRKIVVHAFMLSLALGLYGALLADFIPSDAWLSLGFYVSIALAATLTLWLYWAHYTGTLQGRGKKWARMVAFLAIPFMMFGLCYLCLMYAIPDIGTRFIGKKAVVTELVTTHVNSPSAGRSTGGNLNEIVCRYSIEGPGLENAFLDRICTYGSIPGRSSAPTPLDLAGRRTWFGFHVTDITMNRAVGQLE